MLRKRNRSFQKDQYKGHLMTDSSSAAASESSSYLGQKQKSTSFFNVPGLFVGFSIKGGASDSESARSPTSPLDYRFFTNLGNPFRSPRAYNDGSPKSWNCSKVGLGIVDSLNDETKPSGKVIGLSKSRNILFGSQMGINIPASPARLYGSIDSSISTQSLPENYAVASQTKINSPGIQLNSSRVAFGTGELQLEPKPIGGIRSCLSDSGKRMSPLTSLTYGNPIYSSEDFSSDKKISEGSPPIIGGDPDFNNFLGVKPSSLPVSFIYGQELKGSVSASDIELSEDYTCVISHGPNPKTTHIFGDCILECHMNELANCTNKKEDQGIKSPELVEGSGGSLAYPSDDFLSFCYFCQKKLEEGKDIYMYRGEKAFCSGDCRTQGILVEEEKEKALKNSTDDSPKPASCEDIFLAGALLVVVPSGTDVRSTSDGCTDKKRCTSCRKRVEQMGFKCRCGHTFCSVHRYAEEHGCTFDYRGTASKTTTSYIV